MRVGVFADLGFPDYGGAHRIGVEFLCHFLEAAPVSRHRFVIFAEKGGKKRFDGSRPANVEWLYFDRSALVRKIAENGERVRAVMRKIFHPSKALLPVHWLERASVKQGIEFMWFLGPSFAPVRMPYLYPVLDLQHRMNPWFPELASGRMWQNYEDILSRMIPRAAMVVTSTALGKSEVERFYRVPPERIHVIPYPTPRFALEPHEAKDRNAVLQKYHIPPDAPYLFYPAQFWSWKNHANLLYALDLLHREHRLFYQLVLAGSDKGTLPHVRAIIRDFHLEKYVHILGFVPTEDLIELYRHAFALTYVTFCGPDNLPSLEAMALGCPVIASPEPGILEQLGEAVLSVDPRDIHDIASKIRRLHEDPLLRRRLVDRGSSLARSLTGKQYCERVFSLLDQFEPVRRTWPRRGRPW